MPAKINVNKEIAKGSLWMLLMRFSVKGLGLISTIILARLLMPEDFGLIAMAMTVIAFIDLFQTIGVDMALIQNKNATEEHYHTAWTIKVILGICCGLVVAGAANYTATFFDEPRLENILYVLAGALFLFGFPNIGLVDFQKEMTFKYDFYYQVSTKFVSFLITLTAAFLLRSYWALIIGQLSASIMRIVLSYYLHPFRPKFCLTKYRELLGFSFWILLNGLLRFTNTQSQYIFLGRFAKSDNVGFYKLSEEIATITSAEIIAPINRAAYPGYSKLADQQEKLKNSYLNVFAMISLIAIPSATGIALVAPELVLVLFGSKWADMIPVVQTIALGSVFSALSINSTYIFFALLKQKTVTVIMAVKSAVFISLLLYLTPLNGAIGAAQALLLSELLTFPLWHLYVGRLLNMKLSEWLNVLYRPVLSSVLMAFTLIALRQVLPVENFNDFISLILLCTVGFLIFTFSTLILSQLSKAETLEQTVIKKVFQKLGVQR